MVEPAGGFAVFQAHGLKNGTFRRLEHWLELPFKRQRSFST
jgi:hypothetical protein